MFGFFGTLGWRGGELDRVDEAEVDDVDGDLGIVTTFQSAQDVLFGDCGHKGLFQFTLGRLFGDDVLKSLPPFGLAQGRQGSQRSQGKTFHDG